jgi:hypothetical protein
LLKGPDEFRRPEGRSRDRQTDYSPLYGAIAFTVTFLDKFRPHATQTAVALPFGLYVAWILFGLTVGFALWHLMALNGNISAMARKANRWTLTKAEQESADGDERNARIPGLLMIASFFLSIVSLVWLGFSLG